MKRLMLLVIIAAVVFQAHDRIGSLTVRGGVGERGARVYVDGRLVGTLRTRELGDISAVDTQVPIGSHRELMFVSEQGETLRARHRLDENSDANLSFAAHRVHLVTTSALRETAAVADTGDNSDD